MSTQPQQHTDTPTAAEALLHRAHSPDTASTLYRERVQLRPLLLRPTSPDRSRNARAQRQRARLRAAAAARKSRKPAPLSAKQKRRLGVYEIPAAQRKYAIYAPLHRLWCAYMHEILGVGGGGSDSDRRYVDPDSAGPMLTSADYHGARLEVVRSRCVSRVGVAGIVVKDTKFTFELVTAQDEIKVVPKEGTVFRFEVPLDDGLGAGEGGQASSAGSTAAADVQQLPPPLVFEIYGSRFETRAPDRAVKKVKQHVIPDL